MQKGQAIPVRQTQAPAQQQQAQQAQQTALAPWAPFASPAFSDPFFNTFGGGGALAPWGGLGGGALAPFGGLGGGMLSPFGGLGMGGELMAPLMNQALGELNRVQQRALAALPGPMRVDVVETDSEYRLVADLPGVAMRDVKIDVDANNVLRISAEKADSVEQDETRVSRALACARAAGREHARKQASMGRARASERASARAQCA